MAKQTPAALQSSAGLLRTPGIPYKGTTIHTLVTSNGSPYLNFQNRIMCAPNMHPSPAQPILSCLLAFSVAILEGPASPYLGILAQAAPVISLCRRPHFFHLIVHDRFFLCWWPGMPHTRQCRSSQEGSSWWHSPASCIGPSLTSCTVRWPSVSQSISRTELSGITT